MLTAFEFKALLAEASISVEAAHLVARSFTRHRIVPSHDIDELIKLLDEASESLAKVTSAQAVEGRIFPTLESARAALASIPKPDATDFRIAQDGAGRARIKLVIDNP